MNASTDPSRRRFVLGALAAGVGSGLGASGFFGPATAEARPRTPTQLPSERILSRWLERMVAPGPRWTGSASHNAFVDTIDAGFSRIGLRVHRDRHVFTRWLARRWALELRRPSGHQQVPVASYYSYSGSTPPGGVEGELVYLGAVPPPSLPGNPLYLEATAAALSRERDEVDRRLLARLQAVPGGVRGKVVLMDALIPPTSFGDLYPLVSDLYDPAGTLGPTADYKRAWTLLATLPSLAAFEQAGVAGVVFTLDASWADAVGQYAPFIQALQKVPALLVDRETGVRLRRAADGSARARLTLDAEVTKGAHTDTVWTLLPGATDELMIVDTHTDGPNAVEENGPLASLALARHFAAQPRSRRRRGLVFTCVTGHFAAEVPSTPAWVAAHQDLVQRAVAGLALEHLGAREWRDDPLRGYHRTGMPEPTLIFHSQTPILAAGARAVQRADLQRTAFLRPAGATFLGEGAALHESGIPTLGFLPAPGYLLSFAHHQHVDKVDVRLMRRQIGWAARLLDRLDTVPAAVLAAGDSTVLPPQLGGVIPVE